MSRLPQRSRSGERGHSERRLLNGQTHPDRVQKRTNTKRRSSMSTCIRKVVTATAAILALTLLLAAPTSAKRMPPGCDANLLDETISRSPSGPTALAGDVINYTIFVTNHIRQPGGCDPATPNAQCTGAGTPFNCCTGAGTGTCVCQTGCNTSTVTANFCCPDAAGRPGGPTDPPPPCASRAGHINLFTDASILANDVTVQFGPFPCTMPAIGGLAPPNNTATAGVFGGGNLDDGTGPGGGPSPFEIDKEIAVIIVTTTTTSTTLTTPSLSRTPGFWRNHPSFITGT